MYAAPSHTCVSTDLRRIIPAVPLLSDPPHVQRPQAREPPHHSLHHPTRRPHHPQRLLTNKNFRPADDTR
jgi:hypothetical protein